MSRALLQDGGGDAPAPGGAPVLFGEQEILDAVTWGSGAFNPFQTPAVMVADWLGFVILGGSSILLWYMMTSFYGPRGDDKYFVGYRESKVFCVFVNSFAAYVYWARCASHANGDVGPVAYIHLLKYVDYLFTCPLLTADLLCALNLPFKVSYPYFVWLTIGTGVGCTKFVGAARYMWFCMGMGIFAFAWWAVFQVVMLRLRQIAGSKLTQKAASTIQFAAAIYFSIWHGFPILWLLLEFKAINNPVSLCMHAVLDVVAKSLYGFVLLSFALTCEKEEYVFLPLMPRVERNNEDNESDDLGRPDVELGYHLTEEGLIANRTPMGPIVGTSKQRRMSRELQAEAARQAGIPYAAPMTAPPMGGNDETAILRQIQQLNSQLNDMVPGDRRM
jgi:hypothetical protein